MTIPPGRYPGGVAQAQQLAQEHAVLLQEHVNLAVMVIKGMCQIFGQAQLGDPGAKSITAAWLEAMEAARAASKGIQVVTQTLPKQ
jgi:hypothetical protein